MTVVSRTEAEGKPPSGVDTCSGDNIEEGDIILYFGGSGQP